MVCTENDAISHVRMDAQINVIVTLGRVRAVNQGCGELNVTLRAHPEVVAINVTRLPEAA